MRGCYVPWDRMNIMNLEEAERTRYLNPQDITLPPGYQIEVFASGLNAPIDLDFMDDGSLLIAESGFIGGNPRVLKLSNGSFQVIAEGFRTPISGVTYHKNKIYVAHRGFVSTINPDGTFTHVISGLPSNGDYGNSNVEFDSNDMLYFGQGTVTNSGVVGLDNAWVSGRPFLHDNPGGYIMLNGQNFETQNTMALGPESAYTGAFSPFGETNSPYEVRKGVIKASGSILRSRPDGTKLEVLTWGLRYPSHIKFDNSGRLFASNQGYDNRGSRPVANAPDEFHRINSDLWYGWPDYAGGEPLTDSRFQPEGGKRLEFLLTNHPNIPPRPYASFPASSAIMGFDFCYNGFGTYGNVFIAEYGGSSLVVDGDPTPYAGIGHRISEIDMRSGGITTFAINRSGFSSSLTREGGLSRPVDVLFGLNNDMYIVDLGINATNNPNLYYPETGVIWRVFRV